MPKILSHSPAETKKLAKKLAKKLKPPLVLALTGDLGSGKTTFIQGFARGLGIKKKILSPTFIIFRKFEIRNSKSETNSKFKIKNSKFQFLYHIDCYRIQKPQELLNLGFKKIISEPQNIVLIEWAEKIKKILPKKTIWLKFNYGLKENERIITY